MDWKDQKQVKKGDIGEKIIHNYLSKKLLTIYSPTTQNSHICDGIVFKSEKLFFLYDVKTKGKTNIHNAQGIDKIHFNRYNELMNQLKIPFFIYFVDDHNGDVHLADLQKLNVKGYINIKKDGSIIGWDVENLKYLFTIDQEKINELNKYNTRNYSYKHIQKPIDFYGGN